MNMENFHIKDLNFSSLIVKPDALNQLIKPNFIMIIKTFEKKVLSKT
jgi:hypothetical protein